MSLVRHWPLVFVLQAGSPYANRAAFWSIKHTVEAVGFATRSLHAHVPTFGEWGWHIGHIGRRPNFTHSMPAGLRYLDEDTLKAAGVFPLPLRAQETDLQVSTRIDPWVMRLYQKGEPLSGDSLYPGSAER